MKDDIYKHSGAELIADLGKRFRSYRKRMGMTQKDVSNQAGLSVFTISEFEKGTGTGITMASFLKLLRAVEYLEEIEKILPPLPQSPREMYKNKV